MTNICEVDFAIKVNGFKDGDFSPTKYNTESNNSSDFARALIMYLLEMDHLEPELEEYLHPPSNS